LSYPKLYRLGKSELSLDAWAKAVGIKSTTLHERIRRGWPFEQAIALEVGESRQRAVRHVRLYEHQGLKLPLSEWARIAGLRRTTLAQRLSYGWSFAEAISRDARPRRSPGADPGRTSNEEIDACVAS
jgi:lambda repressor-like predicted transcriptional regulator